MAEFSNLSFSPLLTCSVADHTPTLQIFGELEKFEISFKIEACKIILPQAYT
jgi:hypothetical protein